MPEAPAETLDDVVRRIASAEEFSKTILLVRFADGTTLYERKAADTFVGALRKIGLARVEALGLRSNRLPLVTRKRPDTAYAYGEADGWFVGTHSSTEAKRRALEDIARRLDVAIEVEVIVTRMGV